MGVWVGLCVWLRGGTVLAGRLLECPNRFHHAEDAPRTFSAQIRWFLDKHLHSGVRFDTPATDHKLPLVDKPLGPLFNKVQRYGLVIRNLSLLSYHSVEAIICQGGRISKHHTEKSNMFQ